METGENKLEEQSQIIAQKYNRESDVELIMLDRIGGLVPDIAVGALAGFLAGIVTGGLGSRVAMRIIAVTAGSDMQGVLTEQEVPVGEITAGGTVLLILFGGFMGVIGGRKKGR